MPLAMQLGASVEIDASEETLELHWMTQDILLTAGETVQRFGIPTTSTLIRYLKEESNL